MFSGFDFLCAWKKLLPHLSGVWNTCYFHMFFGKWSTLRSIFFRWVGWFKPPSSHEFKIITSFHDFVRTPRVRNRFMTKCHSVHFFLPHKTPTPGWLKFIQRFYNPFFLLLNWLYNSFMWIPMYPSSIHEIMSSLAPLDVSLGKDPKKSHWPNGGCPAMPGS